MADTRNGLLNNVNTTYVSIAQYLEPGTISHVRTKEASPRLLCATTTVTYPRRPTARETYNIQPTGELRCYLHAARASITWR